MAMFVVSALSCSDSAGSSAGVVQIVSATVAPLVAPCSGPHAGIEQTYTLTFHVHMVNTTSEDVDVTGVSSTGIVVRATVEEDVGKSMNTFASLPYTPAGARLVAKSGDRNLAVTLFAGCGNNPIPGGIAFRDVYTTLRVTTTAGQFATPVMDVKIEWRPAFGSIQTKR